MGWRPRDVLECTSWEFWAAWYGWEAANSVEPQSAPMTRQELDNYIRDWNPNGGRA